MVKALKIGMLCMGVMILETQASCYRSHNENTLKNIENLHTVLKLTPVDISKLPEDELYKKAAIYKASVLIEDQANLPYEDDTKNMLLMIKRIADPQGLKMSEFRKNENPTAQKITAELMKLTVECLAAVAQDKDNEWSMCAEKALNDAASGENTPLKNAAEIALKKLETKEKPVEVIKENSGPSTSHPTSSEKSDQ